MGYAITVDRVPLGDSLRERLEHVAAPQIAKARADEVEQAVDRLFDGAAHRMEIPQDTKVRIRAAKQRARESALAYERQFAIEVNAEFLYDEACKRGDAATVIEGAVGHLTAAKGSADRMGVIAKEHEATVLALIASAKGAISPEATAHVGPAFDLQIARALDAVVLFSSAVGLNTQAVRFQLGGHVEDDGSGFASVHVWPVE